MAFFMVPPRGRGLILAVAVCFVATKADGAERHAIARQVPIPPPPKAAGSTSGLDAPPSPAARQRQGRLRVAGPVRVLVVAPHPDDETIGAAGLMQRVVELGGRVHVVFVTNGDGFRSAVTKDARGRSVSQDDYVAYGERRHREALRALAVLGRGQITSAFLGFPDDGIDDLWGENWLDSRPYRSPFTNAIRPPYRHSPSGIDYSGMDLRAQMRQSLIEFAPDWIVIPDPRDFHPDHCAAGGFVLDAVAELRAGGHANLARAQVLTYVVHYPEYPGNHAWQESIATSGICATTVANERLAQAAWTALELTSEEVSTKRQALTRYQSQLRVMDRFLALFVTAREVFGRLDGSQITALSQEYSTRWREHRRN
jgi:LmbE family N-acetylglucosaminyl deacetylase